MNRLAGRGELLAVTLRLKHKDGRELLFIVDTGTSGTVFDSSLAPELGPKKSSVKVNQWGHHIDSSLYAAPRLYLGNSRLKVSGGYITTFDLKPLSAWMRRPIMGVLGMDVLEHYCIQFDFQAGEMRFLKNRKADRNNWGRPYSIVPLNSRDSRPALAQNLFGEQGPRSLIDSGYNKDGWLMPKYYQQWTNGAVALTSGLVHSPNGSFDGTEYPQVRLDENNVESDGIGLYFLARHLVTLDFPNHTLYLKLQSIGPLPDPRVKTMPTNSRATTADKE